MERLPKSVLQTLAYFDIFDHPLTSEELYRFLYTDFTDFKIDYSDFVERLEHIDGIEAKQGFYFLPSREKIVETRQRGIKFIEEKMKIAKRGIKKIRWIPFARAVFVCNTVASAGVSEESDVDVFVVVRKGRLWLTRLLITLVLSLFGLRRTKKKIKNKICLSFYVVDSRLNLEDLAIGNNDIYLIYWLAQLIPVYDPDKIFDSIQEANQWIKRYIPNASEPYKVLHRWKVGNSNLNGHVKKFFEKMWGEGYGRVIENQAKNIQLSKMKRNKASVQNENDKRVVIQDDILKFHENDRRVEYRREWLKRCRELGINV